MCTHFAIMCDYELLSKTQFVLDLTIFSQGHSAVSIRFFTCTSPCWHSAVSIRVPTTPLHVYIFIATVLCQ